MAAPEVPSPPPPTPGVGARAVRSGIWLWGRQVVTNVVSLGTTAILARHLTPAAFGLVALSQVVMRFLAVLSRAGVGDYVIVDRAEGREARASAAFWFNLSLTSLVLLAGFGVLPWVTRLYHEPLLPKLLLVFYFKFLFDELLVVPDALVKRSLDYHRLVMRDGSLQMFSSMASATLALLGFGVWSLVLPYLVAQPLRFGIVVAMARWTPSAHLGLREWPKIARFSGSVLGAQLAVQVANDSDNLVVGKLLGSSALGIYNNAWNVTVLLSQNTVGVAGPLVLPSLAAAATDPERLRQAFRRVIRVLSLLTIPAFTGMFVLAEEFVLTLYGPQWHAVVLPLRILIIFAARRAIGSPATAIYSVVGRPDVGMRLSLAFIPFYLPSVLIGAHWGIVGVAMGVAIARTLWGFVQFRVTFRLVGETSRAMWNQVAPVFWSSMLMGAIVFAAHEAVLHFVALPPVVGLIGFAGFGALAYVAILRVGFAPVRREIRTIAGELSPRLAGWVTRVLGQR